MSKNRIMYFVMAGLGLAVILIGIFGSTIVDQYGPHNVFYMLGEYFGPKGEHQGFISLGTPILMFLTAALYIAPMIIWIMNGINDKKGRFFSGFFIPLMILQIVWMFLLFTYVTFELQIFFDMTESTVPGWAYWFVTIATIAEFVLTIVAKNLLKSEA